MTQGPLKARTCFVISLIVSVVYLELVLRRGPSRASGRRSGEPRDERIEHSTSITKRPY